MQIRKEEYNGALYQMSLYPVGVLPLSSPRERAGRKKLTSEAKKKINENNRRFRLMQLINANFVGGRDLFVCLTYKDTPGGRDLENFHRRMKKAYKKLGLEYKYVSVTEAHDMEGVPIREHHHLILPGEYLLFRELCRTIENCWGLGDVDVRTLYEGGDFFEDTAAYLLKENNTRFSHKYSTSRNLRPPNEPIRMRESESAVTETPPGVKIVEQTVKANEFGRFEYVVGKIVDKQAFEAYWERRRKKALGNPWDKIRRRRQRMRGFE